VASSSACGIIVSRKDANGRRLGPNAELLSSMPVPATIKPVIPSPSPASCWVIHDGAAGNRRQALALAGALQIPSREIALDVRGPRRWLAPRKLPGAADFATEFAQGRSHAAPTLAIGCGRIAALATRQLREGGIKAIQILDPRISTRHWDLVIAPEHDRLAGDNVITLLGSLNPIDADWLQSARQQFPALANLSGPRTAVLLGGPTRAVRFDRSALEVLLGKLEYWLARDGGSLMICGSRRSPPEWAQLIRDRYRGEGQWVWMDDRDGDNPYAGVLAWADRIIVSPDSVNMISEACATSVPVYIAEPARATGRVHRFIQSLLDRGRVQAQSRDAAPFAVTALAETSQLAEQVRQRLNLY
jgi:mitochondrial fission protein ELM1